MAAVAAAPAGLPFHLGTRRIIERIASTTFTPGGARIDQELAKVGYLSGLILHLKGTYTVVTGSPGPMAGFPYDYLQRITLDIPGINDPVSISGSMLHLQNFADHGLAMQLPGIGTFDADQMASTAEKSAGYFTAWAPVYPVAVAANVWNMALWLPAAHNDRDLRGLLPLGNKGTARVTITPAAHADMVATTANVSTTALTLDIYQVYYTAPPVGVATPDTSWAVVFDEYEQSVSAVGDQIVDVPRDGIILNILHSYRNVNTAYPIASDVAAQLSAVSLRLNRDKLVDNLPIAAQLMEQNAGKLIPFPAGTVAYDFDKRQNGVPYQDGNGERIPGWVYSDDLNEIKSTLTVPTGATLTSAKIRTSVKRLMRAG